MNIDLIDFAENGILQMNQRCRQHTSLDGKKHQIKRKPQCSSIDSEREKIFSKKYEKTVRPAHLL
jgi:hypothetical protein